MVNNKGIKRLIFLTSTVKPKDLPFFGTVEERRMEYINNIKYLLKKTDYPILIVDNSGYDFKNDFPNEERLEALYYVEDNKNVKGKGYGELQLMKYGFTHSLFIKDANQIVKITGRHIIANIKKILKHCPNINTIYADATLDLQSARTYFFLSPPIFYNDYLFPRMEELNDSEGYFLEHLVADSIKKWMKNKENYRELFNPLYIIGHAGTSPIAYKRPNFRRYLNIYAKYYLSRIIYGQ